jgi:hypothetical protein
MSELQPKLGNMKSPLTTSLRKQLKIIEHR